MAVDMPEVRVYRQQDEAALVALWQRCGLTRPWNDPGKDIARKLAVQADCFGVIDARAVAAAGARTGASDEAGPGAGLVADALIGSVMAGYEGHRGWVNYLAVDPAHQRKGLGRVLMAWAEARLREAGCPKINLQIRAGNDAAIGFYRAIGFAVDDVVSMGKRLEHD